jgi:hypothetical protein
MELSNEYLDEEGARCPGGFWEELDARGAEWDFPARKATCARCPEGRSTNPYDSHLCLAGGQRRIRDAEFMLGPASNCLLGKWQGLGTSRLWPTEDEIKVLRIRGQKQRLGRAVRAAVEGMGEQERDALLERLVEAGVLLPETAADMAEGDYEPAEPVVPIP